MIQLLLRILKLTAGKELRTHPAGDFFLNFNQLQ